MHEIFHLVGICPDSVLHPDLLDFCLIHFHDIIWYLQNNYLSLSMKKKGRNVIKEMPKPKHQIGDIVSVNFLGTVYSCKVLNLLKNKYNTERWIYTVEVIDSGLIIPYVGIDQSETFANII